MDTVAEGTHAMRMAAFGQSGEARATQELRIHAGTLEPVGRRGRIADSHGHAFTQLPTDDIRTARRGGAVIRVDCIPQWWPRGGQAN